MDDLTPLDARESLLMDNPPRKDYAEMSKFNFTGPYEPIGIIKFRSHSTAGWAAQIVW